MEEEQEEEERKKRTKHQRKTPLFSIPLPNHPRDRALTRTDLTAPPSVGTCLLLKSVRVSARACVKRGDGRVGSAHEGIPRTRDAVMGWDCRARTPAGASEHTCAALRQ